MLKLFLPLVLFMLALCFFSCGTGRAANRYGALATVPFAPYKTLDEGIPFEVKDYQNKSKGAPLPVWLAAYLSGGIAELENLNAYTNQYCFILEWSNNSLDMLLRRAEVFKIERDFAPSAFQRIYTRFVQGLTRSPDVVYGNAFETLMKRSISADWTDAHADGSCWAFIAWTGVHSLHTIEGEIGGTESDAVLSDTYKLFVLVTINKTDFQHQFNVIVSSIDLEKTGSKAQSSAFQNITRNNFFSGF
ncbi:MAG: hypothetical protein LBT01_04680 [Spirochaetaceae bacterium]|jgi:hypothetical protein|nr:hypothetical protein [Spirochaetaceae bacterium]